MGAVIRLATLAALLGTALWAADEPDLAPLPLALPRPSYRVLPEFMPVPGGVDPQWLEAAHEERPRAVPLVPRGIAQLALNKPVTASGRPYAGDLAIVTDGQKEAYEDTAVELKPRTQWVQIDLGASHQLYHIALWHCHLAPIVVRDVVVQVSDDPTFAAGVTTLFNNDRDNSHGLGVGADKDYWETYEGRLVDARQLSARYVRCYSRGSSYTDSLNRWTEIEVWGMPRVTEP